MLAARLRRPALAATVLLTLATPLAQAGSVDAPEIVDVRKDEATEPAGIPLCPGGICPPAFSSYPGDIEQAWVGPEDGTMIRLNVQINGSTGASSSTLEWTWTLHWSLVGADAMVAVTVGAGGGLVCGGVAASCDVNSTGVPGSQVFEFRVLKSALGDPAGGSVMTNLWVESHGRPQSSTSTAAGASDRAPDTGFGSDYTMSGRPAAADANTISGSGSASASTSPAGSDAPKAASGLVSTTLALALVGAGLLRRRDGPQP